MEQDKSLQSLFKQFEQGVPELKTIQEVEQQLQTIKSVKKYSIKKISILMGTLSLITLLAYVVSNNQNNTNAVVIPVAPQTVSTEKVDENPAVESVLTPVNITPQKSEYTPIKLAAQSTVPMESSSDKQPSPSFDPMPENASVKIQLPLDTPKIISTPINFQVVQPFKFLSLTEKELFQLGIVGKDGGIFYEETYSKQKPFSFSYIVKGSSVSTEFSGGGLSILSNSDKYPALITDLRMTEAYGMLNRKSIEDTLEIYNHYQKYLPILVSNHSKKTNPYYSNELIFWLPKSDYYKALLPQWVQAELKQNPEAFSWDMKIGRQYGKKQNASNNDNTLWQTMHAEMNADKLDLLKDVKSISANDALLYKLGFTRDNKNNLRIKLKSGKFKYQVYIKDSTTNVFSDCPSPAYYDKAKSKIKWPLPLFVTDSLSDQGDLNYLRQGSNKDDENNLQAFLNQKHLLTPVRINLGPLSLTEYYWYENTPQFLSCLDPNQLSIAQTIMRDSAKNKALFQSAQISTAALPSPDLKAIYETPKAQFDKINPLMSSSIPSEKLGFKVVQNDLKFYVRTDTSAIPKITNNEVAATILTLTKKGTGIESAMVDAVYGYSILPVYITDDLGKNTYIKFNNDTSSKPVDFNQLIPVLVKTGRSYNVIDMVEKAARPDYLLWYAATPAFLNLLPQQEREDIKKEIKAASLTIDTIIALPCKYTDVCKQHKENISTSNIYPNPANTQLNIGIKFNTLVPLTISVADLSGKVVMQKAWLPNALEDSATIDVSALESGIYYLYVYSNNGDMVVQKVLINH